MSSITAITLQPFSYPLQQAMRTSWGTTTTREGFLLVSQLQDGSLAMGELSPLPGFCGESLAQAEVQCRTCCAALRGYSISELLPLPNLAALLPESAMLYPSVRWALEMLLLDIVGLTQKKSICTLLAETTISPARPHEHQTLEVNALCLSQGDALIQEVGEKQIEGFTTYKLKLASGNNAPTLESQLASIKTLCETFKDTPLKLRIDCNRGFDVDQSKRIFAALSGLAIEYIEEPLSQVDPTSLLALKAESDIPIALDETLCEQSCWDEVLHRRFCDVAVVKPMLLGGFTASLELLTRARDNSLSLAVTSCLEAPVGFAAGVQLACISAEQQQESLSNTHVSTKPLACGFATLAKRANLPGTHGFVVRNGVLRVPDAPGIGLPQDFRRALLALA